MYIIFASYTYIIIIKMTKVFTGMYVGSLNIKCFYGCFMATALILLRCFLPCYTMNSR